jgi:aldehyde dehydrogenase (NAD+)
VADELVQLVKQKTAEVVVGPGLKQDVVMGPCVDAGQMETVLGYLQLASREGHTFVVGDGGRLGGPEFERGFFVGPHVLDHVPPDATVAQEEIFGPVLSIIRVPDYQQALAAANNTRFGLSASIYTADVNRAMDFCDRVQVGIVHVNSPTVGGEAHLPFGGVKETGIGPREQGKTGVEFYTELKTVYVDYTGAVRQTKIY